MKKSIKHQIEDLNILYKHLNQMVLSIEDAKKARDMPDFFNYLDAKNEDLLEQQNLRLKEMVKQYESVLAQISQSIDKIVGTLEGLKE